MTRRSGSATIRFRGDLNDFLEPRLRGRELTYPLAGRPAVKDAIEAFGVPHPEVEAIVVDGRSVGFDFRIDDGARIAVHASIEADGVSPVVQLREAPSRPPCFVADTHLGRLARLLRLLGFDTLYRNDFEDAEIESIAARERRIVLTRDRGLLKRGGVIHGRCVRSDAPFEQAREVISRFDLRGSVRPFSRCTVCNHPLRTAARNEVEPRLPARTRRDHDEFRQCPGCERIYWSGSHVARLRRLVDRLVATSVA